MGTMVAGVARWETATNGGDDCNRRAGEKADTEDKSNSAATPAVLNRLSHIGAILYRSVWIILVWL